MFSAQKLPLLNPVAFSDNYYDNIFPVIFPSLCHIIFKYILYDLYSCACREFVNRKRISQENGQLFIIKKPQFQEDHLIQTTNVVMSEI